tara:strand:- start:753 stop:1565 length:813 start_codon:yes stop_codon:yes gene_type:complete
MSYKTKKGILYKKDVLKFLREDVEDESMDLIFADPPFNINKKYNSGINDNLPEVEYISWCKKWIELSIRKLKEGGAFYIFNTPSNGFKLANILNEQLDFRHWITVQIKQSLPIRGRLYPSHYALLYFTKGKPNTFDPPRISIETCRHCKKDIKDYGGHKKKLNPKGLNIEDVWNDITPVRHSGKKKRKANQLSLKLIDRILDISSNEGDQVLDLFSGSGTFPVVAEIKNRKWIGVDLDDLDIVKERFEYLEDESIELNRLNKNKNKLYSE